MKIKLFISLSDGANVGDIIDVSVDEAARMIAAGAAVPVAEQKTEKANLKTAKETR